MQRDHILKKVILYKAMRGLFGLQGHNWNKLGRGHLGDAVYQILRLQAMWFQTRDFFMFSLCKPM